MKRLLTPQWLDPVPVEIPSDLRQSISGSELLLETLVRRGFSDPQKAKAFLDPSLYTPASGLDLPDLGKAVSRIQTAISRHEKVGVWGDFDVDGQTSTAVLVAALRHFNADVAYHVPVRSTESHGVQIEPLKAFIGLGVQLIITCDTGISANDSVEYAQNQGVDVIITDHHSLPSQLPKTHSAVNPQFLPANHPLQTLSGVGVAYKLIEQLCIEENDPDFPPSLLDLVAIGMIADLAVLTGDARYLVQKGLQLLQNSPRPALKKIFDENHIPALQVNEETISYVFAPRLNAVGRLSDANQIVEFLLSDDPVLIATTYNQIEGLNAERKIRCDQVFRGAQAQLETNPRILDCNLILLSHPEWDGGVVGIVASRLVELYHRPAILLNTSDATIARGSCRSVEGINITEALRQNSNLLINFGGHPMAAGLSVLKEKLNDLQFGLIASINQIMDANQIQPTVPIDAYLDLKNVNLDLLVDLSRLAPFGPGNPPLRFAARNLTIDSIFPLGRAKDHVSVNLQTSEGDAFRFVWWQGADLPRPDGRFDLIFHARANNFKGNVEVQFEWGEFRDSEEQLSSTRNPHKTSSVKNFDLRDCQNPILELSRIDLKPGCLIWSEGDTHYPLPAHNRNEVHAANSLIIWTVPPSPQILEKVLTQVNPAKILWFGNTPPENDLAILISHAASLVKKHFAIEKKGPLSLNFMAASLATTLPISNLLIKWFDLTGKITLDDLDSDFAHILPEKHQENPGLAASTQKELVALYQETVAYRAFYLKTKPIGLLLSSFDHK